MADPKTDINESLCCIALGFIRDYPNETPESFKEMILTDERKRFTGCLQDLEITTKNYQTYKSAFEGKDDWIYGSYFSAKKIKDTLNINLNDYIISRVEKSQDSKAYQIKELAGSAIKEWAKVYDKTNKTWTPGLLSTLNADKINISDIMLIKKNSRTYKDLKKQISITQTTKWDDVDKNPSLLKKLLTPKLYREIINNAWKEGEIYGVSLKKVVVKPDAQGNIPKNPVVSAKILNVDLNAAASQNNYTDEVAFLISSLVSAAKNSHGFDEFNKIIKDTIDLKPVEFLSKDRLDVKYEFKLPSLTNSLKYTCWTNFGGGTNSVYFQEEGSGSASGEGGITLSYFYTLCREIPELRKFISDVKDKRKHYFEEACKKHGVNFNSINSKLGSAALTSGVYNNILYKSIDFKRLVHVLLTEQEPTSNSDIIFPETYQAFKNQSGEGVNLNYTITKDKKTINQKLRLPDMKSVNLLEDFFKEYVDFLSGNNNKMGKFFGVSAKTTKVIETQNKKIQESYDKKFNELVLKEQLEKLKVEQKKLTPKERIKGKDVQDTKKLKQEAAKQFKLAKDIMKKFAKDAHQHSLKSKKNIETEYKKSFALLANAEFGYMYSEHAEEITDLVKKQVLLSLYAAASGRGYIIFNGERFEVDDYFEKDVQGAPFLKIGK